MAKASTLKATATHRVMLYGASNTGKTLAALKLAEHFDIVYIGLENGHDTLFSEHEGKPILTQEQLERIEIINIPDTRSFPMAIETCLKVVKGKYVEICEEHGKVSCMVCKRSYKDREDMENAEYNDRLHQKYFTNLDLSCLPQSTIVIFDSATQLTNSAIAHITKKEPDDYKLDYNDWGHLGQLMDIFYSHIQQLTCNVVVISHDIEAETEGKKKTLVPIAGSRAFSRNVTKYFGETVYAERKNKKHIFSSSTTYATNIQAGSRLGIDLSLIKAGLDDPSPLLAIFKPDVELEKVSVPATHIKHKENGPVIKKSPVREGGESVNSILERIRKKN